MSASCATRRSSPVRLSEACRLNALTMRLSRSAAEPSLLHATEGLVNGKEHEKHRVKSGNYLGRYEKIEQLLTPPGP
jgi:hypothetical protein